MGNCATKKDETQLIAPLNVTSLTYRVEDIRDGFYYSVPVRLGFVCYNVAHNLIFGCSELNWDLPLIESMDGKEFICHIGNIVYTMQTKALDYQLSLRWYHYIFAGQEILYQFVSHLPFVSAGLFAGMRLVLQSMDNSDIKVISLSSNMQIQDFQIHTDVRYQRPIIRIQDDTLFRYGRETIEINLRTRKQKIKKNSFNHQCQWIVFQQAEQELLFEYFDHCRLSSSITSYINISEDPTQIGYHWITNGLTRRQACTNFFSLVPNFPLDITNLINSYIPPLSFTHLQTLPIHGRYNQI